MSEVCAVPPAVPRHPVPVERRAALRPPRHREDSAGQGSGHRVQHHLLQHLRLHHRQQVARGLRKTCQGGSVGRDVRAAMETVKEIR